MVDSIIIKAGDLVVCVDDGPPKPLKELHLRVKDRVKRGSVYRVTAVVWLYGEKGLHLHGVDHRPTDGWRVGRFRKLHRCSAEFLQMLASGPRVDFAEGVPSHAS